MKRILILAVLSLVVASVQAQQTPLQTQYMQNYFLVNPAAAGENDFADLRFGYRKQWVGLAESPSTFYVTGHTRLGAPAQETYSLLPAIGRSAVPNLTKPQVPLVRAHKGFHALGARAMHDRYGLFANTFVSLSYAYHLPVGKQSYLSLGARAGVMQYQFNASQAELERPNDPAFAGDFSQTMPDFGGGIYFRSTHWTAGLAGEHLVSQNWKSAYRGEELNKTQAHYYGSLGYRFTLNPRWDLTPSVMVRVTDQADPAIDLNAKVVYDSRWWGGLSFRHQDAVSIILGATFAEVYDLSYSYDYTTSDLNIASQGSHEIVFGYRLYRVQNTVNRRRFTF